MSLKTNRKNYHWKQFVNSTQQEVFDIKPLLVQYLWGMLFEQLKLMAQVVHLGLWVGNKYILLFEKLSMNCVLEIEEALHVQYITHFKQIQLRRNTPVHFISKVNGLVGIQIWIYSDTNINLLRFGSFLCG